MAKPTIDDTSSYVAPDYTEGKLYDLSRGQIGWFLAYLMMALVVVIVPDQLWLKAFCVPFLVIGALGAWTYNDGAGYLIHDDKRQSQRMLKKGTNVADGGVTPGDEEWFDFSLIGIPLGTEDPEGECAQDIGHVLPTGFFVNQALTRIAFVVQYGGSKRSAMDWDDRMAAEQKVIDVLAQAAAAIGFELERPTVGHSVSSRPFNAQPTLDWLANDQLHLDFVKPDEGTVEHRMGVALDDRVRSMAVNGSDVLYSFTITLDLPELWANQIRAGEPLENLESSSLLMLVSQIESGLRESGQEDAHCPNILELDEWFQIKWNVAKAGKLHDKNYNRRRRFKQMSLADVIEELTQGSLLPSGFMKLGPRHFYCNGTYFTTLRTVSFGGNRKFRPGGMVGLQLPKGTRWNTTTVVGSIVSADTEERNLTKSIVYSEALRQMSDTSGKYVSAREREEMSRSQTQQTGLYEQNAPVWKFSRYVQVAAPSHALLLLYYAFTVAAHALRLIKLKPIELPVRQVRAFAQGLFGWEL